jgi:Na+/proline symporter
MLPNADTENLFPLLAQLHLHPILFGVVLASIFAAIMSTADSQLLVAASSVVRDLYEKILRKGEVIPAEKHWYLYSRMVVFLLVVFSLLFGFLAEDLVFWLVLLCLGRTWAHQSAPPLYWLSIGREPQGREFLPAWSRVQLVTIGWYLIPVLKGDNVRADTGLSSQHSLPHGLSASIPHLPRIPEEPLKI